MAKKNKREKPDKFKGQEKGINITPKTSKQKKLMDSIRDHQMVITCGYPGTGKTYVPTMLACKAYLKGDIDKIYLSRPNISSGKSLGFRPGNMMEKMEEWFAEIFSIMAECLTRNGLEIALKTGNIEIVPFETMRGRSFRDGIVLLDEAQNTEPREMKMFVTRIGDAQVIANGDVLQSDLKQTSGLSTAIDIINKYHMDVPVIEFQEEDIIRGDLCREWIINWMSWENSK